MSNHSISACLGNWSAIFTQEHSFNYTYMSRILFVANHFFFRQLIAGRVVSSQPMKRKEKSNDNKIIIIIPNLVTIISTFFLLVICFLTSIVYCDIYLSLWRNITKATKNTVVPLMEAKINVHIPNHHATVTAPLPKLWTHET